MTPAPLECRGCGGAGLVLEPDGDGEHREAACSECGGAGRGPEGLVYERRPGHAEGWVRCSLERTAAGPRMVLECSGYRYALAPTAFVLEGVTRSLRALTPEELLTGRAALGPVGVRALERLGAREEAA